MTIKEKLCEPLGKFYIETSKELEEIADDYAIEFAYWLIYQDICQRGENNFVCADGVQRSTKELLEIFKKEKGL